MIRVAAHGATHVGRLRDHNEDDLYVGDDAWVVADGLGGHEGGEIASALVVREIPAALGRGCSLSDAVVCANAALRHRIGTQGPPGMGTTVVAARVVDEIVEVASVGDSRVYRAIVDDPGSLAQVTRDDSYVQDLVDAGRITAEDARYHPDRNVVMNFLGNLPKSRFKEVDTTSFGVKPGSVLLLCSDGLTEHVNDEAIATALAGCTDPQATVEALVQAALDDGGTDNVTVVVVLWPPEGG